MKPAFTLLELLVVLAIVAVLVSILLPVLGKARNSAQDATCKGNHHQMAAGWSALMVETNGRIPNTVTAGFDNRWDTRLFEVMGLEPNTTTPSLACPTALTLFGDLTATAGVTSYGINVRWQVGGAPGENEGKKFSSLPSPSEYPWLGDTFVNGVVQPPLIYDEFGIRADQDWRLGFFHESDTANISWADASVESVDRSFLDGPLDENGVPLVFFIDGAGVRPSLAANRLLRPLLAQGSAGLW
ncbi:MAG: prepilin-type N-terminal cleavage/methylation domain-containing protein [Planctomycetota bacterium]